MDKTLPPPLFALLPKNLKTIAQTGIPLQTVQKGRGIVAEVLCVQDGWEQGVEVGAIFLGPGGQGGYEAFVNLG